MTKNELRVVFDTNILVSAALSKRSTSRQALRQTQTHGVVLSTIETLEELEEVLYRSKFDRYLDDEDRVDFFKEYLERIEPVVVTEAIAECRDPKDNKFLELAVSGNASHIITGDADLLVMNPFRGISIVTPQEFLATLSETQRDETPNGEDKS